MAKTIARATGYDSSRVKETHRLVSRAANAVAATWHTCATAYVCADGSGYIKVTRNGQILHHFDFEKG